MNAVRFRKLLTASMVLATSLTHAADDLPIVPDGFVVDVIAREPMVSNACVLAFDQRGRLFVGQGPQWRGPTPETPGDRVDQLIDTDGDGIADERKTFAEGFNSVQGLAWFGGDLYVANAPDLTIVRDLDGDDEADEYVRLYTGLGNLEHSLHGLNFGPDGLLYMSKGNSKGYNRLDQLAPKAFRDLWGLPSPEGAVDLPDPEVFTKEAYRRKYHTPQDDWGQQGGILRCQPDGTELEIVSRGFRNPWDICFDDRFDWLGTDNDQTQGDKVFAPFYGSHFGWGHPWSFDWKGIDHPPTVPISMPLYEGSGAGLIHYRATHFPEEYRDVFFVNDWMRREVYLFQPEWQGAFRRHKGGGFPEVFAHAGGGRSIPGSSGRVFEPTDIEVGPDGALYVLSWGHSYGATIFDGKQIDAGRVYRIRHADSPLVEWKHPRRSKALSELTSEELFADLGSSIPTWRTNAQAEFIRRGEKSITFLAEKLGTELTLAEQTWTLWTLGRISPESLKADAAAHNDDVNVAIQTIRILGRTSSKNLAPFVAFDSTNARIRHASVQAVWQSRRDEYVEQLVDLVAGENDRIVFYSTWNALKDLVPVQERKQWLEDDRPGVRTAALLGLFDTDALTADEALAMRLDPDPRVGAVAEMWLQKTGGAEPLVTLTPPPGVYPEPISVAVRTSVPRGRLTYTTDGSTPVNTSPGVPDALTISEDTTLRIAVAQDHTQAGPVTTGKYEIRPIPAYRHRSFIGDFFVASGHPYEFDWTGLRAGKRYYTDRDYIITSVPPELHGMPFLQTYNNDDRQLGDSWLSFTSESDVTVYVCVDACVNAPLSWMRTDEPDGFRSTGLQIATVDTEFDVFEKDYPAGRITLGANLNRPDDSGRGNYIVAFKRDILSRDVSASNAVTVDEVLARMATADSERGRELFLHPKGAGCFKCHQMSGRGQVLAPDLSDIGSRAKSPKVLIESILHPSAVITEGFAQQQIITVDGLVLSGAVLQETGRSLKLVDTAGKVTEVLTADIEQRHGTKLSPMPDGFGKMMTAQEVADLSAWLMTQTVVGDRAGFSFKDRPDQLEIRFGNEQIATYLKSNSNLTRRALVNVRTPSGIQVTRNYPPRKPEDIDPGYGAEDGIIHPHMHPGIWVGYGDVNGNDYWRLQAKVEFDGFAKPLQGDKDSGRFFARNKFLSKDGSRVVCTETTDYQFRRVPAGVVLRIDATYESDTDFYFGDQEESGLAIRVASPIRVQGGNGTIVNDRGERNGAGTWGKEAKWYDYSGTIDGREVGIMVAAGPSNFRPSWMHSRDYGVVVFNPFPKQPRERREPYVKTPVQAGEPLSLSYGILIHDKPADEPLDRDKAYQTLLQCLEAK